jgi:hypothetical protein
MEGLATSWQVALSRPRPSGFRSLALAAALGVAPAPALVRDVDTLRRELSADPDDKTRDERVKAFLATHASVPDLEVKLVRAVLTVGGSSTASVATVRELDRVLRAAVERLGTNNVPPAEALTLQRLSSLAAAWPTAPGQPEWPSGPAQRALVLADRLSEAGAYPRTITWAGGLFDEAARARHDGEILLRARGFVPVTEAAEGLDAAASRFDAILAAGRGLASAHAALERALDLLPVAADYLDEMPSIEEPWRSASKRATELAQRLSPPEAQYKAASDLIPTVEGLNRLADALDVDLKEIRGPIEGLSRRLLDVGAEPPAPEQGGADVRAIDRLLATPLPLASQRRALWGSARQLARPLLAASRDADEKAALGLDDSTSDQEDGTDDEADDEPDDEPNAPAAFPPAVNQTRTLLALAGLDPSRRGPIDTLIAGDPSVAAELRLSRLVREAWDSLASPARRVEPSGPDRLGLVLPAREPSPVLDVPESSPYVVVRARGWEDLAHRLADRFEAEARDMGGEPSLVEDAASLRDFVERLLSSLKLSPSPAAAAGRVKGSPFYGPDLPTAILSRDAGTAKVVVPVRDNEAARPGAIEPVGGDPAWLRVRREADGSDATPGTVAFLAELALSAGDTHGPPPAGFLLRASRGGDIDHYYRPVPVEFDLDTTQPRVLVSADPEKPRSPRSEIRLRPLSAVQPYYLYLSNPADRERKLKVELKVGDRALVGGAAEVTLARGQTGKVEFALPSSTPAPAAASPPPPTAPKAELPELTGPLTVVLSDATTGKTLAERRIPVSIASPLDYVQVAGASFEPPGPGNGGKNKLTVVLRATSSFEGPPCSARLVLSPERVPGLVSVKDTTTVGELAKPGDTLTLTASELVLADSDVDTGTFTVDLDGVARALVFRAAFARHGGPTTPSLDFRPALRARAGDVGASGAPYAVTAEPDNAPPGSGLRIRLGHAGLTGFVADRALPPLPTPRRRRVGFGVRDKALAFTAQVTDWASPIDSEGVEGRRLIEVRLVDREGNTIREAIVPVAFDRSAPNGVRIVGAPLHAKPGATLALRAVGGASVSGTKEVVFFPGRPTADGKLPAGAATVKATPDTVDPSAWSASVPLPEKKGPADLSVAFVNAVGLASFDTVTVELTDADLTPPGQILGRVTEHDVRQPGLKVFLADEKGLERASVVTDDKGSYRFEAVAPGRYRVLTSKPATPSKADAIVTVTPGQQVALDLDLKYGR